MAGKTPLGRIKDAAIDTLKHPWGTAGKAVELTKSTATIGKMVAGQVTRSAATIAAEGVGVVTGRSSRARDSYEQDTQAAESATQLRPVPPVNEPGHPPVAAPATQTAKLQGDPIAPQQKAPQRKAAAKKAAPAVKKAESANKAASAKKAAAKKAAPVQDVNGEPEPTPVPDVTPADVAKTVAKKSPADTAPAKKAPAKKAPAKRASAPSEATPGDQPLTDQTDEPLIDPSVAKAVRSESQTLQQAAEPDKG